MSGPDCQVPEQPHAADVDEKKPGHGAEAVSPTSSRKKWEVSDDGHDDAESWHKTLNMTQQRIKEVEEKPLGLADVCSYEFEVLSATFVPMVLTVGSLLALVYPLYMYAQDAIPILIEKGFVPDADALRQLRLCPPNAGDDCIDPRFVMTYGVQEQFGQIYDGYLPQIPMWLTTTMFWVPLVFFVIITLWGVIAASKQAVVDGKKQDYVDLRQGWKAVGAVNVLGVLPFLGAQSAKAVGKISSVPGSFVSILAVGVVFWLTVRKARALECDVGVAKGYMFSCVWTALVMVAINQYVVKKVTTQAGFCVLWAVWTLFGEVVLSYWRVKLRNVDLSKVDPRIVPLLSLGPFVTINCGKRIPLLCLTDYTYIIVMNIACLIFEVTQRVTVVQRDLWIDRTFFRQSKEESEAWMDVMHRQTYLHNEMIQEMLELLFPLPITVALYMIQYSPEGKVVLLAPIMTNCVLQIVQELVADCCCIYVGSAKQNKFYRVAKMSLFTRESYRMLVFIVSLTCYTLNGVYFYTYLRVGLTPEGDYLTLI